MNKNFIYIIGGGGVILLLLVGFVVLSQTKINREVSEVGSALTEVRSRIAEIEPVIQRVIKILPSESQGPQTNTINIAGQIKYSDLEGGCWYIDANIPCQSDKCPLSEMPGYTPTNLPDALKQDGLRATFTLKVRTDLASICMLGPAVEIVDYQISK